MVPRVPQHLLNAALKKLTLLLAAATLINEAKRKVFTKNPLRYNSENFQHSTFKALDQTIYRTLWDHPIHGSPNTKPYTPSDYEARTLSAADTLLSRKV